MPKQTISKIGSLALEQTASQTPRKVALFSGHMIDAPGREVPRFPPDKEAVAAQAIGQALDDVGVGAGDLAICGGACGGDLLFADAALARGARLSLYLPFEEPQFLEKSVAFAGDNWRERFLSAKARAALHILPRERETLPGSDPYEQNNIWMLEIAEAYGAREIEFICLWDGQAGDGPGGTKHMMEELGRKGGRVIWLDTRDLWG
ncbi:hypothetical protein [Methylocystis bryophila]|uniref:Uncharacterized protein n=1 Tax=Methylocystis bryophila TaxID=655015 RepID=A0A1W6N1X6_9HYPH|nr:hypothetical protein [Methylocystis bryophila]ARN83818.1 hypothetical protein B1812_19530 [Methylocystis bryophila]